jgi:hypothetical protein
MGTKICPSTSCIVNKGTNPATVISAENKTVLSTCRALMRISRKRSVQPRAGVAVTSVENVAETKQSVDIMHIDISRIEAS